ncbi:MAG: translation elongation factor G, partial [Erysipelotrichaceae bacterium]|nr:translation elongation factor G [Erysipelotrichaceae bacterium]
LDAAVVIISGLDSVQSHTETILKLLATYHIPFFFFVNKMDNAHFSEEELMEQLIKVCPGCVDFNQEDYLEKAAECSDELLDKFFEGEIEDIDLQQAIKQRVLFPCFFGSALKNQGIVELLDGLDRYLPQVTYPDAFGMRVFKISRDVKGERLSHVKITGGILKAKDVLENGDKVDQIRVYTGTTFTMLQEAEAGTVCALKGPTALQALQGLGFEENTSLNTNSCMSGCLVLPKGVDSFAFYRQLKVLEEEDPSLHLQYNNEKKEIHVHIMGEIQTQVLLQEIENRFKVKAQLTDAAITYKETIKYPVEGVGHYEPLRHYAEAHLLLEPLPRGKGLVIDSNCPVDVLPLGWQKQILSSLDEAYLTGTLTNSE